MSAVDGGRAGIERQRMGRIVAAAAPVLSSIVPLTMPLVGYSRAETAVWALLILPTTLVGSVVCWNLAWHRWSDAALLSVPIAAFCCLSVLGLASDGRASVYSGFTALIFLFIGLTQRPWTSIALLPAALLAQMIMYDGVNGELAARMPISVTVWVATAEIVSRFRMRTSDTFVALESQAQVDALTGLRNRHGLDRVLSRLTEGDSLLLVDLDRFKRLNDSAGHAAGDDVLRAFGVMVRDVARATDHTFRYGGEEFLVVLIGGGEAGARRLDRRLRAAWSATGGQVTYSAGIAVVGTGQGTIVDRADKALYAAKAAGRDRTVVYGTQAAVDLSESDLSVG